MIYRSFKQVFEDARSGVFANESELRQSFIEALKEELRRSKCSIHIVNNWLIPALDRALKEKRPDIRISNFIIEVENPNSDLSKGQKQLKEYLDKLWEILKGRLPVYGLVTNGVIAELWEKDLTGKSKVIKGPDDMPVVAKEALEIFCSHKIPVTSSEDIIRIFGV